jgi:DNA repair ATPase RecN
MLKRLSIRNLVLVERVDLEFSPGLTAITGETGAGKTALLEAFRLFLGERANVSKIRRDSTKAYITAVFDVALSPQIEAIFKTSGVPLAQNEPLVIIREIPKEEKSRCFVSAEQVTLGFLAKLAPFLVKMIGQHTQIDLKKAHIQQELLDQFASTDLSEFQRCLKKKMHSWKSSIKSERLRKNLTIFGFGLKLSNLKYLHTSLKKKRTYLPNSLYYLTPKRSNFTPKLQQT